MVQTIRRTPRDPRKTKGQEFAETLTSGLKTYADYDTKKKQALALKKYLGKGYEDQDIENWDEDLRKEAVKQVSKTKARSQYFGGNDPLSQPQPGTFAEQLQGAPVDVQTGETPASENAGETEGQKIKKLQQQVENFPYEDEDDYERPKINKPKQIPMPGPFKPPHSQDQVKKSLGWNVQEGRALQQENADARRAYDAEVKRIQQENQHAEKLSFGKEKFKRQKNLDLQNRISDSYKENQPYIEKSFDQFEDAMRKEAITGRMIQLQDEGKLSDSGVINFLEQMGFQAEWLKNPANEEYNKLGLDLLGGGTLQADYGSRVLASEFKVSQQRIPTLSQTEEGRRQITENIRTLLLPSILKQERLQYYLDKAERTGEPLPHNLRGKIVNDIKPQLEEAYDKFKQRNGRYKVRSGTFPDDNSIEKYYYLSEGNKEKAYKMMREDGYEFDTQ